MDGSRTRSLFMMFGLILVLASLTWPGTLHGETVPGDVAGDWNGVLDLGAIELRLVFHLDRAADGTLRATLDSPDQGASNIPVARTSFTEGALVLDVATVRGVYEGRLSADGTTLEGEWKQGGNTLPLTMHRGAQAPLRRPQEPKEPFPYRVETVSYVNPEASGVTLAGTLTEPSADGPVPAVLLVSGSGPQDRDEAIMGHRPFFVLADYLTRRGIAVLRVDDRGVGKSTGEFAKATTEDFASDARAGIAFLKTRSEVNPARIGIVGHSEGGIVAPMVAAHSSDVAFIVLMAGTGVPGDEILYEQGALLGRVGGESEQEIRGQREVQEKMFAVIKAGGDPTSTESELRRIMEDALATMPAEAREMAGGKANVDLQVKQLLSPWMRFFLSYDPRPTLKQVKCPVLAVNGENDLQVPAHTNLDAIEAAVRSGGNADVTVKLLPGLNHLFQTSATGSPMEYGKIEETIAPSALETIGAWIQEKARHS